MDSKQKLVTTLLWATCVLAMVTVVTGVLARRSAQHGDGHEAQLVSVNGSAGPGGALFAAPAFSLTNQDGQIVTSEQLRGHAYVAAFVFTNCASTCPMMSAHMAKLQQAIPDPDVKLVSFTVDPIRDTPERLKTYAAKFKADEQRWHFLTGTPGQMTAVTAGFKVNVRDDTPADDQVAHSERLFLVDKAGNVRGTFLGTKEEALKDLADAAAKLEAQPTADVR